MKISVIIPCRNSAQHLEDTLKCLVDQTWKDFEVIAVDDFSSDETPAILVSYTHLLNLRVVRPTVPLKSASASRNLGFSHSTGDYIKFLDSDDVLSPSQIEMQWNALRSTSAEMVAVSGWSRFNRKPGELPVEHIESEVSLAPDEWIIRSMEAGHSMMQCGMFLIPRPLFKKSGLWRPEPAPTDDFEFFIRLLLHAKAIVPTQGVLWYRSGQPGSLSRKADAIHAQNAADRVTEALERLLVSTDDDSRVRTLAGRIYYDWAKSFFPQHPQISLRLQTAALACGVINCKVEGGSILRWVSKFLGWKCARRLQYYSHKIRQKCHLCKTLY